MMLKPTFTNGKDHQGGHITVSSRIPPSELDRILQTSSFPETIVALLNEAESSHSWQRKSALSWKECPHCRAIFLMYRKDKRSTCSRQCNGVDRGAEWAKHAHKGRSGWTEASRSGCREKMTGPSNPAWKGGLTYFKRGGKYKDQSIKYVRCPAEFMTMARMDGYVTEHRLVMAMAIGRPLTRQECVHHIDHDATNNSIENLMLFASNADHKRFEHGQAIDPLWQPSRRSDTLA